MLKKILKIFLIVLAVGILAGLVFWLVLAKRWPWWMGVAILIGLLGIWVGVLFLRKYLLRRKEKAFVERVIAQDEEAIKMAPIHERQQLLDLQEQWKESVVRLRNSHLRKRGNPLYVLPWYLVIGESGSGKTSAIKNARLSSPLTDIGPTAGISATRNCDWWFFDEAIILDTAGRYTIPIDESLDKEEWKNFLVLLAKYRRREPLNGVIVTISADKLLNLEANALREDGQSVRQRIDQLMRTTGAKSPVYLLVTKMDLVHGFTDFCSHLPEASISQALGSINEKLNPYWQEFLDRAMTDVSNRLKDVRFVLANELTASDPGALFFSSEFEQLRPGLEIFAKAVFEENPYQETPLFRGLYFSSARQEGRLHSEFLQLTGITPAYNHVEFLENGLFLKDIFKSILPNDRYLFRPIREFLRWRSLTSSQGLLAWTMVWLSLCGLLSYSFFHNSMTIGEFTKEFYNPPARTRDMSADLMMLDKLRVEILEMERENKNWWVPRFGLDDSIRIERKLKSNFVHLFGDSLLRPFDAAIEKQIEDVSPHTPDYEMVLYTSYVVNRINLFREVLKGESFSHVAQFNDVCTNLVAREYPQIPPEIASKFDDLYYSYLLWYEDREDFPGKIKELQVAMTRLLEKKEGDFKWLVGIFMPDTSDVRLSDFWGASEEGSYDGQVSVSKAYTDEGRKHIKDFITLVDKALLNEKLSEDQKKSFWRWYEQQFYESWSGFAGRFNEGIDGLVTVSAWKQMVTLMTTDQNPYFRLIDRMSDELSRMGKSSVTPKWASLVLALDEIRNITSIEKEKEKGTLRAKVESIKEKFVQEKKEIVDRQEVKKLEEKLKIVKVWKDYDKAREQLSPVAISPDTCFRMVSDYFNPGADEKQSPFLVVHTEGFKLKSMMQDMGDAPFVWNLVLGPFNFLVDYGVMEAGCAMQDKWEDQILGVLQGAGREKAPQLLFNKTDGAVWKFIGGPVKPFISRSKNGYIARKVFDRSVPFNPEFFDFLNGGAQSVAVSRPEYAVTMKTLPLQVNKGARLEPYGNIIALDCSEGKVSLENYNYPQSKTFRWNPDKCGDVTLKILLPNLVLTKTYEGSLGFARFLSEFRYGIRDFKAEEFPSEQQRLKDMGISWIRLSYWMSGKKAVVELLKDVSVQAPAEIIPCWSR